MAIQFICEGTGECAQYWLTGTEGQAEKEMMRLIQRTLKQVRNACLLRAVFDVMARCMGVGTRVLK